MVTPYPDLRHFTTRDYGNRVGVFRILRALKAHGIRATFALSADLLARAAPLAEAIVEDGHEIAAAGLTATPSTTARWTRTRSAAALRPSAPPSTAPASRPRHG